MSRAVASIIRSACRKPSDRLIIATYGCGPVVDPLLYATNDLFLMVGLPGQKRLDKLPAENVILLDQNARDAQIPLDLSPDLIVMPHDEVPMFSAKALSGSLGIPTICFWCRPPETSWTQTRKRYASSHRGDVNVFASEELADAWGVEGIVMPEDIRGLLVAAACSPFVLRQE